MARYNSVEALHDHRWMMECWKADGSMHFMLALYDTEEEARDMLVRLAGKPAFADVELKVGHYRLTRIGDDE